MDRKIRLGSMKALLALTLAFGVALPGQVSCAEHDGFLETVHRHATLTSTIAENGDLNPTAIALSPVTAGHLHEGDVLVDNFNNAANLQGMGVTIMRYRPSIGETVLFARLPHTLEQCPGGVGLGIAMTVLKSGWVIVGSAPSSDGSMDTRGTGCLLVLDAHGHLRAVWSDPNINYPWSNIVGVDSGDRATLFIGMAGFDVPGPGAQDPETGEVPTVRKATVLRLSLSVKDAEPPVITEETVVADGFGQQPDEGAFLIGPTGLALGRDGVLYVADSVDNRIVAVDGALDRTDSARDGREITRDGLLRQPLAMAMTPGGNLLVTNAKNGQVVEIDPEAGRQLYAHWINVNPVQPAPGNGALFGIAMRPDGNGFYYVSDDINALVEASR